MQMRRGLDVRAAAVASCDEVNIRQVVVTEFLSSSYYFFLEINYFSLSLYRLFHFVSLVTLEESDFFWIWKAVFVCFFHQKKTMNQVRKLGQTR